MPCFGGERKAPSFKNSNTREAPNLKLQDRLIWNRHTSQTSRPMGLFMQVLHDGIRAVVGAELFKDFLQVTVDGPGADAKQAGDFLIRMAFAEQRKNLVFAVGQLRQMVCGTADG